MAVAPITKITRTARFEKELKSLKPNILAAAKDAIRDLYAVPIPASRRFHCLNGFKNPRIFTIDVTTNHSYKISFELNGSTANLRRIATHKEIDRKP